MEGFPLILIFISLWSTADGYQHFQERVPNGDSVPHPCRVYYTWHGLGHIDRMGGGDRNPFGRDFHTNGMKWDECLCRADSDGDGRSNGEELGDPDCIWTPGTEPSRLEKITHPGICEPIESEYCKERNKELGDFCKEDKFECDSINDPDVKRIDIRINATKVPAKETTYYCAEFHLPLDGDYHIIATDVYIDNPNVLHHVVMRGCYDAPQTLRLRNRYDIPTTQGLCPYVRNTIRNGGQCYGGFVSWSLGRPGFCISKDKPYGIRIGLKGFKRALLELHWNNPTERDDYVDSSGVTLWYTARRRPFDAGLFKSGPISLTLPPHQREATDEAMCSARCLREFGMAKPINIFASMAHMHFLGSKIYDDIYVNGTFQRRLLGTDHYSYDYPEFVFHKTPLIVNPGEDVKTTCIFDTSKVDKWTYFGESAYDEMCNVYHWYYPNQYRFVACEPYGLNDSSCLMGYPGYSGETHISKENALDLMSPENELTAPLVKNVLHSCDHHGVSCLPGCEEAITALKKTGHPSFASEKEMEYVFYTLVFINIDKYEKFVSAMRSCTPIPVATIDLEDIFKTENETPKNESTHAYAEEEMCMLARVASTSTSNTSSNIIVVMLYLFSIIWLV